MNSLFEKLATLTGYNESPVRASPRPGDLRRITLDSGLAGRYLNWTPNRSLDEGLWETVDWFKRQAVGVVESLSAAGR